MSLQDRLTFDPTALSTAGLFFAQLALGVLAIMAMSSEYSTGTIRTTLAAVPQRGYVLAAKALLVAWTQPGARPRDRVQPRSSSAQAIFSSYGIHVSISAQATLRAVDRRRGSTSALLTLFALGLAAIIRHTAGAITALVAIVFIVPDREQPAAGLLAAQLLRYLPANAGGSITQVIHQPDTLRRGGASSCSSLGRVVSVGVGWILLRTPRRLTGAARARRLAQVLGTRARRPGAPAAFACAAASRRGPVDRLARSGRPWKPRPRQVVRENWYAP